jgi:hypothetical protein
MSKAWTIVTLLFSMPALAAVSSNPDTTADAFRNAVMKKNYKQAKLMFSRAASASLKSNDSLHSLRYSFTKVSNPDLYTPIEISNSSTRSSSGSFDTSPEMIIKTSYQYYYARDLKPMELDLVTHKMVTPALDYIIVTVECVEDSETVCSEQACGFHVDRGCSISDVTIE